MTCFRNRTHLCTQMAHRRKPYFQKVSQSLLLFFLYCLHKPCKGLNIPPCKEFIYRFVLLFLFKWSTVWIIKRILRIPLFDFFPFYFFKQVFIVSCKLAIFFLPVSTVRA